MLIIHNPLLAALLSIALPFLSNFDFEHRQVPPAFGSEAWLLETTPKAEQGDADAQYSLGMYYYCNSRNPSEEEIERQKESAKWMRKAAEQGHGMAQYTLGSIYSHGMGVAKDATEAAKWFRKAAENESTREEHRITAQGLLGSWYYHGHGVPKDKAESVKWYRKAADPNNVNGQPRAQAQLELGKRYYKGEGVAEDRMEAIKWLRLAKESGEQIGYLWISRPASELLQRLEKESGVTESNNVPDGL